MTLGPKMVPSGEKVTESTFLASVTVELPMMRIKALSAAEWV